MLRITIDLVPYGVEKDKHTLSEFEIVNTGLTRRPDTYHVRKVGNRSPILEFQHHRDAGLHKCVIDALTGLEQLGLDKVF